MRKYGINKPEGPAAVSLQWGSEWEFKQCFKQCKVYTVFPSALKNTPKQLETQNDIFYSCTCTSRYPTLLALLSQQEKH